MCAFGLVLFSMRCVMVLGCRSCLAPGFLCAVLYLPRMCIERFLRGTSAAELSCLVPCAVLLSLTPQMPASSARK